MKKYLLNIFAVIILITNVINVNAQNSNEKFDFIVAKDNSTPYNSIQEVLH